MTEKTIKKVEAETKQSSDCGESKKVLHYPHSDPSSGSFVHNVQLQSINYGVVLQTNDVRIDIRFLGDMALNLVRFMKDIEENGG